MKKHHLPEEITSQASIKKVIKLIGFTLFFLILIDGIVYLYLKFNTPNLAYEIVIKKWEMLKNMSNKRDWVVLGDSTCNQGMPVSMLEKKFNASAVNLCAIGGMLTVNDSWILETYIKKFGPPKNVLIIHTYDLWQREKVDLGLASQLPLSTIIREKPNPWIFDKKSEVILLLNKYWPLFSQKQSLIEIISILFKKGNVKFERSFDQNGFMSIKEADPQTVLDEAVTKKKRLENIKFNISRNNLAGLENIRNLAEKHDFNVFIANSPVYREVFEDVNFQSYFADIKSYLKKYADKSEKIYYIDNEYAFSENEMVSVDHIIESAAQEYSFKLSEEIEKMLFISTIYTR